MVKFLECQKSIIFRKNYKPKAKGVENKLSNKTKQNKTKLLEQACYHFNPNKQHPDHIHIVSRNK